MDATHSQSPSCHAVTTHYSFLTGLPSVMGDLLLAAGAEALSGVYFLLEAGSARDGLPAYGIEKSEGWRPAPDHPVLRQAAGELRQYFAGQRQAFSVAVAPQGTPFQRQVWRELVRIPFGVTRSYADIARGVGRPTAFRAVGLANGRNPISIIVPCHRVIGSAGQLTGYGGGLPRKVLLLELERRVLHASLGAQSIQGQGQTPGQAAAL